MLGICMATCRHQIQDRKLAAWNSFRNSSIWLTPSSRTNSHFHCREFLIAQRSLGPAVGASDSYDHPISYIYKAVQESRLFSKNTYLQNAMELLVGNDGSNNFWRQWGYPLCYGADARVVGWPVHRVWLQANPDSRVK